MKGPRRRALRAGNPSTDYTAAPATDAAIVSTVHRLESVADRLEGVYERLVPAIERVTGHHPPVKEADAPGEADA